MDPRRWDALEADLAESVYQRGEQTAHAVFNVCSRHGNAPVEYLVFSLASLTVVLESEWLPGKPEELHRLLELHQSCTSVAVDLAAARLEGFEISTCSDLLRYWENTGNYAD